MLFPETKGRTLEEMDALFADSYWIVPMSQAAKVGAHDRERELAMGTSNTSKVHVVDEADLYVQKEKVYLPRRSLDTRSTVLEPMNLESERVSLESSLGVFYGRRVEDEW